MVARITKLVRPVVVAVAFVACGSSGGTTAPAPSDPGSASPPSVHPPTAVAPLPRPVQPGGNEYDHGPPYPIILMHGMGGFDELQGPIDLTYFYGVIDDLNAHGENLVFVTTAPPFDTSEDRAAALVPQIQAILEQTHKDKVNLVGHSQGGMDARVLASPNGLAMGDVIASVTTIATPHRGSLVADLVLGLLQDVPASTVDQVSSAFLSLLQKTVYDVQNDPQLRAQLIELSQQYMTSTFNPKYVDAPGVPYSSYGGRTNLEDGLPDCATDVVYADDPTRLDMAQPEVSATATFLQGTTGTVNDGLVTIASARWGTFLQCETADHLAEVGQLVQNGPDALSGFDHLAFFRDVTGRIRAQGL